jgi:hypothetical protein
MKGRALVGAAAAIAALIASPVSDVAQAADSPTTSIETEYLGTLRVATEPPQMAGARMIYNVTNCTLQGPKIMAACVPPSANWTTPMLDGFIRLDFRATLKTDESEFIFMEGGGFITDGHSMATPRFMTNSRTYGWLNSVQAIAKMVAIGKGWTNYDVFVVR